MLASIHKHTELILDSFWNVGQLVMHESRQTAVEFLGVTDNARGSVQHSSAYNDLRRPGENCIAVIHTGRHESVDECGSRLRVE